MKPYFVCFGVVAIVGIVAACAVEPGGIPPLDGGTPDGTTDSGGDTGGNGMDGSADAATDGGADAPPPGCDAGVTFAADAGVRIWLNGGTGVSVTNGRITQWADQSGNNNNANQGPNGGPQYVQNSINGLPGAGFSPNAGAVLLVDDSQTLQWGQGDFLIEVVAKFSNDPNDMTNGVAALYMKGRFTECTGPGLFANVYSCPPNYSQSAGAEGIVDSTHFAGNMVAYNDGAPRVYAVRRVNGNLELRVNGNIVSTSSGATADVSSVGIRVRIGALYNGGSHRLDGDIAEIIAASGTQVSSLTAPIETYLMCKYGL